MPRRFVNSPRWSACVSHHDDFNPASAQGPLRLRSLCYAPLSRIRVSRKNSKNELTMDDGLFSAHRVGASRTKSCGTTTSAKLDWRAVSCVYPPSWEGYHRRSMTALAPVLTVILSLLIYRVVPHPLVLTGLLFASVSIYLMAE